MSHFTLALVKPRVIAGFVHAIFFFFFLIMAGGRHVPGTIAD